jgi:hypothetical protein
LEGLGIENIVTFYDHLEYGHLAIWDNLQPFGTYTCSLWSFGIFFSVLECFDQEKSGNPEHEYIHTFIRTYIRTYAH